MQHGCIRPWTLLEGKRAKKPQILAFPLLVPLGVCSPGVCRADGCLQTNVLLSSCIQPPGGPSVTFSSWTPCPHTVTPPPRLDQKMHRDIPLPLLDLSGGSNAPTVRRGSNRDTEASNWHLGGATIDANPIRVKMSDGYSWPTSGLRARERTCTRTSQQSSSRSLACKNCGIMNIHCGTQLTGLQCNLLQDNRILMGSAVHTGRPEYLL